MRKNLDGTVLSIRYLDSRRLQYGRQYGTTIVGFTKCRTVGEDAKGFLQIPIQEAQKRGASRECKNWQQIG